jgi:hypothetical protein
MRAWWRSQKKEAERYHDKMPCWKQYSVLFFGSILVGACTIAVITLFSIISPINQYFTVYTFGVSVPTSLILHFVVRALMRHLRKRAALQRGRNVEGAFEPQRRGFLGYGAGAQLGAQSNPHKGKLAIETPPAQLFRSQSGHVGSVLLDETKGLADRQVDRLVKWGGVLEDAPSRAMALVQAEESAQATIEPMVQRSSIPAIFPDKSVRAPARARAGQKLRNAHAALGGQKQREKEMEELKIATAARLGVLRARSAGGAASAGQWAGQPGRTGSSRDIGASSQRQDTLRLGKMHSIPKPSPQQV